ncbi:MAG: hypothetical protein II919_06580 [Lachnospiraceae bacterium]|nr:hypothetical protein [Lachnospiraceae bacterium]
MNRAEYDGLLINNHDNGKNHMLEIRTKIRDYPMIEAGFFAGERNSHEMVETVTQPYFRSIELTKKRLDENGITKKTVLRPDVKKKKRRAQEWEEYMQQFDTYYRDSDIKTGEEGHHEFAASSKNVIANHSFYRGGKKAYSYEDHEISTIDLLKVKGDGQYAACPNCGNIALIATYTDGCDYCHSKFKVEDFDLKVSGYSLKENVTKKTKGTYLKSLKTVIRLTVLAFLIMVAMIIVVSLAKNQTKNYLFAGSAFAFSVVFLPVFARGVWLFIRIFLGASILYVIYCIFRRESSKVVKTMLPDFSVTDFCQNLEYKLKNIHMADTAKEVESFAKISLEDVVRKNNGIIECSLVKVRFQKAWEEYNGYQLAISCKMRLIIFENGRFRKKYEKISLRMSLDQSVRVRNMSGNRIGGILAYICPHCGGNVDLLNGGICDYCGHKLDYSKYDWMIEDYKSSLMKVSDYGKIRLAIILFYVLVLGTTFVQKGNRHILRTGYYLIDYANHRDQVLGEIYGIVSKPEIDESKLEVKDLSSDINCKIYHYENVAGYEEAEKYLEVLRDDGAYTLTEIEDDHYIAYRKTTYYHEPVYVKIYVRFNEKMLEIEFHLEDKIEKESDEK